MYTCSSIIGLTSICDATSASFCMLQITAFNTRHPFIYIKVIRVFACFVFLTCMILLEPVSMNSSDVIRRMEPLYYCPRKRLRLPVGST